MAAACPVKHHDASYRKDRTDGPLKCTWFPGTTEKSPHTTSRVVREKLMSNALGFVGETPAVRISKIAAEEGLECELIVKCEFCNAGGSVKDRIGLRMVEEAESSGRIKPGDVLIEPTSGNTGIGIALAAAVKGYKCIITMPEKMSQEKVNVLKALGAQIVRTPTEAAFDSPDSHIGVALRLNKEIPNSHILDQYINPANPLAHYDGTAEEILESCDGEVDCVVVGTGTGGTITGIARKIKERCPSCVVVGVDPRGSILAEPDSLNEEHRLQGYQVEGTGYDFIPTVLDREIVDKWIKTTDFDSFVMARRLIRTEALLCGGSSGGNVWAAVQAAKELGLGKGKKVVTLLPDSIRNYLTKFVSDEWCWSHGIVSEEHGVGVPDSTRETGRWGEGKVGDLTLPTPFTVNPTVTCKEAVDVLAGEGFDQLPVVSADGQVLGVVTEGNLSAKLVAKRISPSTPVSAAMFKQFRKVTLDTPLRELARIFDTDHFALVCTSQRNIGEGGVKELTLVSGVVSRIDLLQHITSLADSPSAATSSGAGGRASS